MTFEEAFVKAINAIGVLGTGKLREGPIVREGARAFWREQGSGIQPSRDPMKQRRFHIQNGSRDFQVEATVRDMLDDLMVHVARYGWSSLGVAGDGPVSYARLIETAIRTLHDKIPNQRD